MQSTYSLAYPPVIIFGEGTLPTLSQHLPASSKVLLVVGTHFHGCGACDTLLASLSGREVALKIGVSHEAPLDAVEEVIERGRSHKASCVVAVGGGSVIDAAKAAAAIIPNTGTLEEYFHGRRELTCESLFFAAAPTTSGTGTEFTRNAVLLEPASKIKKSIRHEWLLPRVALIDPQLSYSCPREVMVFSALDALVQAVESYLSKNTNAASQALALSAVVKIVGSVRTAFTNASATASRYVLSEASMLSGMAFSQSGLGAVHALAHPIGARYFLPHGYVCAVLLPHILKVNLPSRMRELSTLSRACGGGNAPEEFIAIVERLLENLDIPRDFRSHGMTEQDRCFVVANCRSNSMRTNPKQMSDSEVGSLLGKLFRIDPPI